MFGREKRVMNLVRSQRINMPGFQTVARLGRKIWVGSEPCKAVLGE